MKYPILINYDQQQAVGFVQIFDETPLAGEFRLLMVECDGVLAVCHNEHGEILSFGAFPVSQHQSVGKDEGGVDAKDSDSSDARRSSDNPS